MKNLLVLYPGVADLRPGYLARYRWRLRLAGIRMHLADEQLGRTDARDFAGTLTLPPPEECEQAWSRLRPYLEAHRIDAVVAQSESGLLLGAKAAAHLGLPGPGVEAAWATTDKLRCRRALAAAGVPQPRFAVGRDADDVRRFARGRPVVLKAIASSRQRLVTPLVDEHEAEAVVAELRAALPGARDVRRLVSFARLEGLTLEADPREAFLIEELESGRPVECDGLVARGRFHALGLCEQVMLEDPPLFIEGYLLPAGLAPPTARALEAHTRSALATLGFRDGATSVEFRVEGERVALIEVNGRLGWDEGFGELFSLVTGRFPPLLAVRVALGKPLPSLRRRTRGAVAYRSWYEPGVVTRAPTQAELLRASARGLTCHSHVRAGDRVRRGTHPDSRPHLMHALVQDPESAVRAFERGRRALLGLDLSVEPPPIQPGARPVRMARPVRGTS